MFCLIHSLPNINLQSWVKLLFLIILYMPPVYLSLDTLRLKKIEKDSARIESSGPNQFDNNNVLPSTQQEKKAPV